ncbi:MAG TPA: hypothetical protein VI876_01020 [Dehalococcoidia bacterium]|nr:hypothetical protein [Dehalococcoidia bacterium]
MPILELEDVDLEPLSLDGMDVARVHYHGPPPFTALKFDGREYQYERSFPVKGHGASLPNFLRDRMAEGKKPLLVERTDRFYVYLS